MTDSDNNPTTTATTPNRRPSPEDEDTARNVNEASAADPEAEMFGDTGDEDDASPRTSPANE